MLKHVNALIAPGQKVSWAGSPSGGQQQAAALSLPPGPTHHRNSHLGLPWFRELCQAPSQPRVPGSPCCILWPRRAEVSGREGHCCHCPLGPHISHSAHLCLTRHAFSAFVSLSPWWCCLALSSLWEYLPLPVSSTLTLQHHYFSLCISPLCKYLLGLKNWEAVGSSVALLQVENSNAFPHSALTVPQSPAVLLPTEAHRAPHSLTATKQDVGLPCRPVPRPVPLATNACTLLWGCQREPSLHPPKETSSTPG